MNVARRTLADRLGRFQPGVLRRMFGLSTGRSSGSHIGDMTMFLSIFRQSQTGQRVAGQSCSICENNLYLTIYSTIENHTEADNPAEGRLRRRRSKGIEFRGCPSNIRGRCKFVLKDINFFIPPGRASRWWSERRRKDNARQVADPLIHERGRGLFWTGATARIRQPVYQLWGHLSGLRTVSVQRA